VEGAVRLLDSFAGSRAPDSCSSIEILVAPWVYVSIHGLVPPDGNAVGPGPTNVRGTALQLVIAQVSIGGRYAIISVPRNDHISRDLLP
jgi:hypothetical protein